MTDAESLIRVSFLVGVRDSLTNWPNVVALDEPQARLKARQNGAYIVDIVEFKDLQWAQHAGSVIWGLVQHPDDPHSRVYSNRLQEEPSYKGPTTSLFIGGGRFLFPELLHYNQSHKPEREMLMGAVVDRSNWDEYKVVSTSGETGYMGGKLYTTLIDARPAFRNQQAA